MKKIKVTETPQGAMMFGPRHEVRHSPRSKLSSSASDNFTVQALDGLSNAILRDDRVFHMEGADFIPMYNRQGMRVSLLNYYQPSESSSH